MKMFCGAWAPLGVRMDRIVKDQERAPESYRSVADFCKSCLREYGKGGRDYVALVAWRSGRNFGDWHLEPEPVGSPEGRPAA